MQWTISLNGGPRRVNHAAVSDGSKIYSFGGFCSGPEYYLDQNIDVHVLNTYTNRWKKIENEQTVPDVPFQRYGHTVVVLDKKAYLWGGKCEELSCDKLYIFDLETHRWSCPKVKGEIPRPRDGHSACVINRHMYVFAGFLEFYLFYTQEIKVLDIDKLEWLPAVTVKGTPPHYRDFHTSFAYNDKMYIWGGREAPQGYYISLEYEEYGNEMFRFNTSTHSWETVACTGDIPMGRRSHSAVVYNDKVYVFGGYNSREDIHLNDLYEFDLKRNVWKRLKVQGTYPHERRRHTCCVVDSRLYIFGGTSPRPGFQHYLSGQYDSDLEAGLVDRDDLHVLDLKPSLKTLCLLAVINHKLEPTCLPVHLQMLLKYMMTPNKISRPLNYTG